MASRQPWIRSVQRLIEEKQGRTSVVTIEDPVEMRLDDPAIMQIPVSSAGDGENREEVYRRALMHFSRVNPDVGIISEMRDGYGARQVLQFVSSGHTCYTDDPHEQRQRNTVPPDWVGYPGG